MKFEISKHFKPAGDQPAAIEKLTKGIESDKKHQTLLGVTGSGKTYTIANVIQKVQKPTLIVAHNKTLAAQLCQEFRSFFPNNAVGYFVSYYDYYQPEAYLANSDTYIEKDAAINEEIDRLRHWATTALLSRKDVIIVASVSCIYGLGSPREYKKYMSDVKVGDKINRKEFISKLINLYYSRNETMERGSFRSKANTVDISAPDKDIITRIEIEDDKVTGIYILDKLTRNILEKVNSFFLFPAKHFVVGEETLKNAILDIRRELKDRVKYFIDNGKITEAERLERRTNYDLELLNEIGFCKGIENYSRHLTQRKAGDPPYTLLDYFPDNFLTIIDESHVTISQLNGMYAGDKARKDSLIEYGFRLPSARDNRPLKFDEFENKINNVIYTSATPGKYELEKSKDVVEQIIRPTGLTDPEIVIKPVIGQVDDVILEITKEAKLGHRVLATTLTKKMAENLADYLKEKSVKARYLHSEVDTLDRIRILKDLRLGKFDVLVGVNLLREGLDLPEVTLVAILDADKEGFLRSETSLIQTIGRAARNVDGRVILYADRITDSIRKAQSETTRRRKIQQEYNKKNNITPQTIKKQILSIVADHEKEELPEEFRKTLDIEKLPQIIKDKEKEMNKLAKNLQFEDAALIRDEIKSLRKIKPR